jgi:G3E family GTPase
MARTTRSEASRPPVHVLTGFLGSGKTTLLRHLLGASGMQDTAVVINEFGEVGLDHLLVRGLTEDVVLLSSGCLCCTVRDDLISTLLDLHGSSAAGDIPRFSRVVVETTGLADPMPILQAILSDKRLPRFYRLGGVVTTVDAVNGLTTLDRFPEAVQQVAAAERLIVTKTDLASAADVDALDGRLMQLNSTASRLASRIGDFPCADDLLVDAQAAAPARPAAEVKPVTGHASAGNRHDRVRSFTIALDEPVDLAAFIDWLELLLASRGESVLRVKGYLAAIGHDRPLVIQGVQHVVYRPEPLQEWPASPGRSELVFITRDLTQTAIERSIRSVLDAPARRSPSGAQLPPS